jgi:hypothetical protein
MSEAGVSRKPLNGLNSLVGHISGISRFIIWSLLLAIPSSCAAGEPLSPGSESDAATSVAPSSASEGPPHSEPSPAASEAGGVAPVAAHGGTSIRSAAPGAPNEADAPAMQDAAAPAVDARSTVPPSPPPHDSVDTCPGKQVALSPSTPSISVTASTSPLTNDYRAPACSPLPGGNDAVYRFVAPGSGHARITLQPNGYAGLLYVRQGDCETGTELGCANPGLLNLPATINLEVAAGAVYFVFADQEIGLTQGIFVLTIDYQGNP